MSRLCGYILGCACLPLIFGAEAPAPVPPNAAAEPPQAASTEGAPAAATPDYTPAFERLFALGLPDTRGGVLLKAPAEEAGFNHFGDQAPALPGYAWRMPATAGEPPDYIVAGIARFASEAEVKPPAFHRLGGILQQPSRFAPIVKIPKQCPFVPADAATEVTAALKRLADWKTKRGETQERYDMSERLADHLIFAAQVSRHGQTEAANRLAHLALTATSRGRHVALRATGAIADARWNRFMATWTRNAPDNRALAAELESISARFAQGWKRTGAATLLLSRIRNAPPPEPPALPGRTFTEAQLKFAADLLSLRTMPPTTDWLGSEKSTASPRGLVRPGGKAPAEKSPVIDFLRTQGVEALPLLAALANDNSLTPCVTRADPNQISYSSPDYLQEGEEEREDNPWQIEYELSRWENRPRTRGEIARSLLDCLSDMNFSNGDSDAYADRVLDAYATIKAEGRVGFFIKAARTGSEWERRRAWQSVTGAAVTDADFARIEAAMLESPQKSELFEQVVPQYLRKRTGAAAPFFKKFTAALREDLAELDDAHFTRKPANRYSSSDDDTGAVKTREAALAALDAKVAELAPLVAVAETLTPERRLARILDALDKAGSPNRGFNQQEFTETVAELGDPWEKIIPDILDRAAKNPRTELLWMYLNLAQTAANAGEDEDEDGTPKPQPVDVTRTRFAKLLPKWRTLLGVAAGKSDRTLTILAGADQLHGAPGDMGNYYESMRHLEPEEQLAFMTSRFDARVAATPLPPWPSADRVTAERLAALSAELGALPPEGLRTRYAALTADERVAWTASLDKNPKAMTEATRVARGAIASVKAEPGDEAALRFITDNKLSGYAGRALDPATVREWVMLAVAQKPGKSALHLGITQRPVGLALRVMSLDAENPRRQRGDGDRVQAQFYRAAVTEDGTPENRSATASFTPGAAVDGDAAKDFWKVVATLSDGTQRTANLHFSLTIPKAKSSATPAP